MVAPTTQEYSTQQDVESVARHPLSETGTAGEMDAEREALPGTGDAPPDGESVWIERDRIEPNPWQPRRRFDPTGLREFARSLQQNGQLQECLVRPHPSQEGRYQLIAGERRWRACAAEYADIPRLRCVVRELDDTEALVLALEENARREDLSPLERAQALVHLKNVTPGLHDSGAADKGTRWEDVALRVGMARESVQRLVQLLKLPEAIQQRFEELELNEKHGRGLLLLNEHAALQMNLLQAIEEESLSGNQTLARANEMLKRARTDTGDEPAPANPVPVEEGTGSDEKIDKRVRTRGKAGEESDPWLAVLKPATASLVELKRQLQIIELTMEYRQQVREELDLAQQHIDEIRSIVDSPLP